MTTLYPSRHLNYKGKINALKLLLETLILDIRAWRFIVRSRQNQSFLMYWNYKLLNNTAISTLLPFPVSSKDRCKTPDSPEGARLSQTLPLSPTQSSPTIHPTNGSTSPVNNGSAGSLTPPLPSSGSLSLSLEGNHHQYSHSTYTSPITRPLVKVKRFLSTLVQFGNDIGTDVGDRVRSLVLSLVVSMISIPVNTFVCILCFQSSNLSIEEFHHSLQDVTNFPLRPFVLPFLRTHLPLLQREVHALARASKQVSWSFYRNMETNVAS